MRLASGGHLTYCTNVHAGESWPEVFEQLSQSLVPVREQVAPGEPFGVGLRLSAQAAAQLKQPGELERFASFLAHHSLYVFTLNGFPYGPFHGRPVKADVYRPDWSQPERLQYTGALAELLAYLLPEAMVGSLSTVPLAFKLHATQESRQRCREALVHQAAELARLERRTGREIVLALEPEPGCLLETVEETRAFFEDELFALGRQQLGDKLGLAPAPSEAVLRRHVGVCLDTCHAAVEFEQPEDALAVLKASGIRIAKVQVSAGLKLSPQNAASRERLRAFDEPTYLHQVVARTGSELLRFNDLPEAFASGAAAQADEWRVHFHVPIDRLHLGPFESTQRFVERVLALHAASPLTDHFEVETYTWDVLPAEERDRSLTESLVKELTWARSRL